MTDGYKAVASKIAAMASLYGKDLTPDALAMYVDSLTSLSVQEIHVAVRMAVAKCRFFPLPSELIELAEANKPRKTIDQVKAEQLAMAMAARAKQAEAADAN